MEKPVILAVDDDPQVLRSIARDLRDKYGDEYQILRADSGTSALQTLDELSESASPVALLVSDPWMPDMDAVTFLKQARQKYPDSKRALLTAYADTSAAIAAINESQVDYYLTKPWDPPRDRLYPVIDDLLEDWKANHKLGYGGVRIFGSRWNAESHDLKDFLARNHAPYTFFDVERDEDGQKVAAKVDKSQLPLVVLTTGEKLYAPTVNEVAQKLGLRSSAKQQTYDFSIVGAGPAGLAAAVYGASEGLSTILIEREAPGGQASTSSRIENYLGFPTGIAGDDLGSRAFSQAKRFGAEILVARGVCGLDIGRDAHAVVLDGGDRVEARAIIIATGVSWRRLEALGADRFVGRGLYYGASRTEAPATRGRDIVLVGGGNSAGQAAMFFAGFARTVSLVVRGPSLAASMSHYLIQQLGTQSNVRVETNAQVVAIDGDDHVEAIEIEDRRTGTRRRTAIDAVFVFIGADAETDWLPERVIRDERGYVCTGRDVVDLLGLHVGLWPLGRDPYLLETSVPGVFAAGDVRHGSIKRVAAGVGEGSMAIAFVHPFLADDAANS